MMTAWRGLLSALGLTTTGGTSAPVVHQQFSALYTAGTITRTPIEPDHDTMTCRGTTARKHSTRRVTAWRRSHRHADPYPAWAQGLLQTRLLSGTTLVRPPWPGSWGSGGSSP